MLLVLALGCKIDCDPRSADARQCEELKQQAQRAQDQAARAVDQAVRDAADQTRRAAEAEARRRADELAAEVRRRAEEAAQDARDRLPLIGELLFSQGPFQLSASPAPFASVGSTNWYGNTQFAYEHRAEYYSQPQGLHSGVDFLAPPGTPVTSVLNRAGKVLSVSNHPYDYRTGPHNVLVDYGEYLVLYGHTSASNLPAAGVGINPGDVVARTGADEFGLPHLHLEVIRKDGSWANLPPGQQATTRPGSIRTNPVPFFSQELRDQLATKQWDSFHKIPGTNKWQTPEDQPDITPGGPYLVP